MPSPARSSEMNCTLAHCDSATERSRIVWPITLTSPVASAARPASARNTSIAPEPTWPARQITMPRGATRLKSCTIGGTRRCLTVSIGSPGLLSQRGYISPMLRPSIISIRCSRSISSVRARADQFAVPQHRDGVADLEHLAEPVGDVDDRLAFGLQRAQRAEDAFDLDVGQRRSRFVEDAAPARRGSASGRSRQAAAGRC